MKLGPWESILGPASPETIEEGREIIAAAKAETAHKLSTRRPIPRCGTTAALARHRRYGEVPCEPCLDAGRRYQRDYMAAKKAR